MNHDLYMRRCFELASLGLGKVESNPLVGAVLVHDNQIIGEGYHEVFGGKHAEVNAIESVGKENQRLITESTLYVNLEPCCHTGKTPPCVDLILKNGIKRVVISNRDPNPQVAGKGIQKLLDEGIEVIEGILQGEGRWLNRRFFTFMEQGRPYVILKWAQTQDGFIGKQEEKVWISNHQSNQLSHKWRSEESAIMVATNTAALDNPRLNVREWTGKDPVRVVLDKSLRLPESLHLFDNTVRTIVYTEQDKASEENLEYSKLKFDDNLISNILSDLAQKQISSLIVEGGAVLLNAFLQQNLWDEARIIKSTKQLGQGVKSPELSNSSLLEEIKVGDDIIQFLKPKP